MRTNHGLINLTHARRIHIVQRDSKVIEFFFGGISEAGGNLIERSALDKKIDGTSINSNEWDAIVYLLRSKLELFLLSEVSSSAFCPYSIANDAIRGGGLESWIKKQKN